jgi:hypothetical protein
MTMTSMDASRRPAWTDSASSGEEMFWRAITLTLAAPPVERADLFELLSGDIAAITLAPDSGMRAWTCTVHTGTDGSRIFLGAIATSLVVDPTGRLWRGRSYEDFETTYIITATTCEIETLTPLYAQMREYLPGSFPRAWTPGVVNPLISPR